MRTVRRALEGSTAVRLIARSRRLIRSAVDRAGIVDAGDRLERYVRSSYCYRWLTTEPEPDVIVIDLRETYSVGPVIRLLDRVCAVLVRSYANSNVKPGVDSLVSHARRLPLRELRESRVGKQLEAAFEPPEPRDSEMHEAGPSAESMEESGSDSRAHDIERAGPDADIERTEPDADTELEGGRSG